MEILELFEKRSIVGPAIQELIKEKGYTKRDFCQKAGLSRPTLDKMLLGEINSLTNFEKHLNKITSCLDVSNDSLLGEDKRKVNRIRQLSKLLRINANEIMEETGLSEQRLLEIERGKPATLAELRDIAFSLNVSVRTLLGKNFFEPQVAALDYFISPRTKELSGFWGHIGIKAKNSKKYLWYPISACERKWFYRNVSNDRVVVPCMNNKVLFLNMKNIVDVVLLDDACDGPMALDWDTSVDNFEFPQVFYEVIDDYYYKSEFGEEIPLEDISELLLENLNRLQKEERIDCEQLYIDNHSMTVHYSNGEVRKEQIEFDDNQNISTEVDLSYDLDDYDDFDTFLYYTDWDGAERFINSEQIAYLELPLIQIENKICEDNEIE